MEHTKKILFVANVAKEHILKFHIPTLRLLKKNGWIVDVACSGEEDIPYCDTQMQMCWERTPFTWKTIKGIFDLKKIIDKNQYDVVYCHTPVGGLVARLAAKSIRKNGTKVVYCAHGLHFYKGAPLVNWLIFYPIEKILARYTDTFITINKEDFNLIGTRFKRKEDVCLVAGIGVNFDRLKCEDKFKVRKEYRNKLGISESTTVLIYVAELLSNKNQKMLIDTTKVLLNEGIDVCLLLIGPEHDNGATKQYANEAGIKDKVFFLGWRNDIGQLLYASDICTASSIREGFGINLVEAMYCGLPIVATKNRGHEVIIENGVNGLLVGIGDYKMMAEKIKELMKNRELYRHENVEKYECETIANELVRILSGENVRLLSEV